MLTALQKKTAHAIINIFETGRVSGSYDAVAVLKGDSGHLSYGRSQVTLGSGNLHRLFAAYAETPGAAFKADVMPWLSRMESRDTSLDLDPGFRLILKRAASDPVMRAVQDRFFDEGFWEPAVRAAHGQGFQEPLSVTVIYDSFVHGSFALVSDRVAKAVGDAAHSGEREWLGAYVAARRAWLDGHSNRILRNCVYRMDAFQALMSARNWALDLPLAIRGIRIDEISLASGRILKLEWPFLRGDDVRDMQADLARRGYGLIVDGVFGPATDRQLRAFQAEKGLTVDGIAGVSTLAALENRAF